MRKKGRLIEAARYHPEDSRMHLAHDMETAQLFGDEHKIHYLGETFGINPVTDDDFKKIIGNINRMDPNGIGSRLMLLIVQAEKPSEARRLEKLYDSYMALPEGKRTSGFAVKDILCLALHKRSYFDYPRGSAPVEKFFS